MFDKVPYGVKVRIKGSDETGYTVQNCLHYSRFFRFLNIWNDVASYSANKYSAFKRVVVFATLEEAKEIALKDYAEWISYFKNREEEKKQVKKISKTVWEYP